MMAANPNPARIPAALWRLWTELDAYYPAGLLGGIYAEKTGYHNTRDGNAASNYSVAHLAADRRGPADKASALDWTLGDATMRLHTTRLDDAARARDPRLYSARGPVLREFIGTKDGSTVYCYVLVGGVPLGVGADAGPDPGRDDTHLWHIHLSIIREFCADWPALDGVLSVLRGESLAAWQARTEDGMGEFEEGIAYSVEAALKDGLPNVRRGPSQGDPVWLVGKLNGMATRIDAIAAAEAQRDATARSEIAALRAVVEALSAAIAAGGGSVDTAAILAGVDAAVGAARADVRDAVADLGEGGAAQVRAPQV